MKIWFFSDTHGRHRELEVPEDVDAAICCGDEANHFIAELNAAESMDFCEWWSDLPMEKYFCPGNHSVAIERGLVVPEGLTVCKTVRIGGYNAYFSPYTPSFGRSWAYMKRRDRMDLVWQDIPETTDILVTHGPPKGILDLTHDMDDGHLIQVGCGALRRAVDRIKPMIHAFGHLHDEKGISNHGKLEREGVTFINCAVCELRGGLRHNGIVVEI